METLLSRFSGQPVDLLSFNEIIDKLGLTGQSNLGVRQIPIDAIVGSVGRYQDFTRTFLPRLESDEDRWVSVGTAAPSIADLPPIDVYKIGDSYFVLDGNHRVSLARLQNLDFLDANVIEVRTRAPMPPGAKPDDLIIAAELAAFLAHTRLDILRPAADLQVSVPGQYRHLESHVEAYRFLMEASDGSDLTYEQATARWYDDVYLPLVEAIREQGILRYFPGRTETDFFVWLARHRAELQNELGFTIAPEVTVARLLSRIEPPAAEKRATLAARLRRLTRLTLPEAPPHIPDRTWAQERTLGRYSDHLFATMLYPLVLDEATDHITPSADAFSQAMTLSIEEGALLYVLCILDHPHPTLRESAAVERLRERLISAGARGEILTEFGDPLNWIKKVGFLNDLVIIERSFDRDESLAKAPPAAVREIIADVKRPILVLGATIAAEFPRRVLVVHDTRRRLDEAIFIAAYLAERWNVELSVLPLSNGRNTAEIVTRISDYLALHEVTATFLEPVRPNDRAVENVIELGQAGEYDLLVLTGPERGHNTNRSNQLTDMIWAILQQWSQSALIAT